MSDLQDDFINEEKVILDDSEEEMVFCSKCGTRYSRELDRCPNCGEKNPKPYKKVKKFWYFIGVIASFVLITYLFASCTGANVKYIGDRSIQHDDATEEFTLLFSFQDSNNKKISADATFEIVIENDNGEIVYSGTKNVTKSDFGTWTSPLLGERYLGSIVIKDSEIKQGTSSSGKIRFTAYKENVFAFDESVLDITYNLPVKKPTLTCKQLPVTVG